MRVLIVDDEKLKRMTLETQLQDAGHEVAAADDAEAALELLVRFAPDVMLADIRMPAMDGLELLARTKEEMPETTVIMMTAYGSIDTAVEAMRRGAYDYLAKPFSGDELLVKLDRLGEYLREKKENAILRQELSARPGFHEMIGKSEAMRAVFETLDMVADNESTVLLCGETGTGKEMAAKALHARGSRKDGPLVKVSCASLNEELLESELFGHEKGAFTGATRQKRGRFELADGGTIFLDDIDDIPLSLQVKILRVLQEKEFERVGGEETLSVDVRVVAATKQDLAELIARNRFREDLYYRVSVIPIVVPPLRERPTDIIPLARHFVLKHDRSRKMSGDPLPPDVCRVLLDYPWPGNVRELENAIEHAVAFATSPQFSLADLPESILDPTQKDGADLEGGPLLSGTVSLPDALAAMERRLLQRAQRKYSGNQAKMARSLGIPKSTLRDKLIKFGLLGD
ncbi:MAG: sigma-54-dependent Fis family transcriptional regulator [Planctomycetes bacterium]|nr:sigma-54-dependent Fis family transcriptional regulator [Planctomycetota bacterium]